MTGTIEIGGLVFEYKADVEIDDSEYHDNGSTYMEADITITDILDCIDPRFEDNGPTPADVDAISKNEMCYLVVEDIGADKCNSFTINIPW